jgi:hypothetical protein
MDHLHWRSHVTVTVLALATLGGMTQIGLFLFTSCRPRWSAARKEGGALSQVLSRYTLPM